MALRRPSWNGRQNSRRSYFPASDPAPDFGAFSSRPAIVWPLRSSSRSHGNKVRHVPELELELTDHPLGDVASRPGISENHVTRGARSSIIHAWPLWASAQTAGIERPAVSNQVWKLSEMVAPPHPGRWSGGYGLLGRLADRPDPLCRQPEAAALMRDTFTQPTWHTHHPYQEGPNLHVLLQQVIPEVAMMCGPEGCNRSHLGNVE
jgi:hypothetical protein